MGWEALHQGPTAPDWHAGGWERAARDRTGGGLHTAPEPTPLVPTHCTGGEGVSVGESQATRGRSSVRTRPDHSLPSPPSSWAGGAQRNRAEILLNAVGVQGRSLAITRVFPGPAVLGLEVTPTACSQASPPRAGWSGGRAGWVSEATPRGLWWGGAGRGGAGSTSEVSGPGWGLCSAPSPGAQLGGKAPARG